MKSFCLYPAVVLLGFAMTAASSSAQSADVATISIVGFHPETRTIHPGDSAVSELRVHNSGPASRVVWIGYSVSDVDGQWMDIEPDSIRVGPGETSTPQRREWMVPLMPLPAAGAYRIVMGVWSASPGTPGARRLATADRRNAFRVQWEGGPLVDDPDGLWRATGHQLGRGRMRPENVVTHGAGFELRLEANRCDGAELRSVARYSSGELSARMRTPNAAGSLSALFLFAGVAGGNDEIDIEIYNDGSSKATMTSWIGGEKRRQADVRLPFDPAAAFHDYAIRRSEKDLVLLADGKQLARWTGGYSREPMHALVSAWFPSWLECAHRAAGAALSVEWISLPHALADSASR